MEVNCLFGFFFVDNFSDYVCVFVLLTVADDDGK
jgi:hypothetical protein